MNDLAIEQLRREVSELRREVLALADLVSSTACDPDTGRALADLAERCQRGAAND